MIVNGQVPDVEIQAVYVHFQALPGQQDLFTREELLCDSGRR
jgi:hypothetical protein